MMQQNPSSQNMNREKKDQTRRDAILRRIKSILLDNWGFKLLALLIAVALWAGLITQDPKLTREKIFTDVKVNIVGADTLKRNGYIVLEDIDDALEKVTLRVNVPQGQYNNVQASNYSIRVDLTRINTAGELEVKILYTNSSTYGSVVEVDPPVVTLKVDEYVTRYRIPVMAVLEGEAPEGFYAAAPSSDPPMVAVSGPRTLVDRIASAQVRVDQSSLPAREGTVMRAEPFTLVDEDGNAIQSDMLQVTSESVLLDSIIVEQAVYTQRTVEFSDLGLVIGEPAEGYEIKGVYFTPGSVTIAGKASVIKDMELLYADGTVSVKGMKQSVNKTLRIRQPATLKYISANEVTVAVDIGPVITSRSYEVPVNYRGLSDTFSMTGGAQTAVVTITGAQPWLDALDAGAVTLGCDMSTVLVPGRYTLPLLCRVEGSEGQSFDCDINPASVAVTITAR